MYKNTIAAHCCAAALILFCCSHATAQQRPMEIRSKHWLYGQPVGTPRTNDLVIRDIYALSSNDETKFADWVAYQLTPHEVMGTLDLEREWRADPWLDDEETLEPRPNAGDDYRGASGLGYDRGHLAPLGSFKGSRFASQANFLSNITPQKSALNQGPWRILEERVRALVEKGNTVWVITGPIYEDEMPPLPNADETHTVPSGYWKIVAIEPGNELRVAALVMMQDTPRDSPLENHVERVRAVENRTRLDFFSELPDAQENELENATDAGWLIAGN